jgi:transposase
LVESGPQSVRTAAAAEARRRVATAEYWAEAVIVREQRTLFSPTLDEMIDDDHEVRLLDEALRLMDWTEWENVHKRERGQPPIHPRIIAALWLYGMMRKMRTSRILEYACRHNIDFIWLAEGHTPDHSKLAEFFTHNKSQLKSLFRQVCRMAMTMGLVQLGTVAFDATRVKAANGRFNTLTAAGIEKRLAALDLQIDQMMADVTAAEAAAGDSGGTTLPESIADMKQRRAKLTAALASVRERDEARRKEGINPAKNPAQMPMNDRESSVMPNKEGGYAPNYTPTCLTDGANGFIVDTNVLGSVNETYELIPSVDRTTEMLGKKPENVLTDGGNAAGSVLAGLEDRNITAFAPAKSSEPAADSPVLREDLTQPVPEAEWPLLKMSDRKQLDKSCFVYDEELDQYFCPMGRVLKRKDTETRKGVLLIRYESLDCSGCPLAARCLLKHENPESRRQVRRDEHEKVRHRTAERMATSEGRAMYDNRSPIAETPFGYLKGFLGHRQFLRKGIENCDTEWRWSCLSLNMKKVVRFIRRIRFELSEMLSEEWDPSEFVSNCPVAV